MADSGEPYIESLELGGEAEMIDAEEMEERGLQVMHMDRVFHRAVPEFVGGTVGHAAPDSAAGEEKREPEDMMVPAGPLSHGGAPELAAPDDEGVLEEAGLFEILEESCSGLVGFLGGGLHPVLKPPMVIPAPVIELDHSDPALGKAPSQQTVRGESAGLADAVGIQNGLGFRPEIGQFRDGALHFESHFVLGDPDLGFWVTGTAGVFGIERPDIVKDPALESGRDPGGVVKVMDGLSLVLERDPLELAG